MQNYYKFLRSEIEKSIPSKFKTQAELAEAVGTTQSNISMFLAEKRGMSFDIACRTLDVLGFSFQEKNPTIKRLEEHSPKEEVQRNNLIKVPVCAFSGAGNFIYENLEEIHSIDILPNYYHKDLKIVQIIGDSMQPTIADDSYIGVVPVDNLHIGKVYLVKINPFGLVTKRVYLNKEKEIILKSDNPAHEDITVGYEGYDDIIIGRVMWVWQNV